MIGMRLLLCCVSLAAAAQAQRSLDELITALATEEDPRPVQVELRAGGAEVAQALAHAIHVGWRGAPGEPRARAAAARVLGELGPKGVDGFDELLECARDVNLNAADLDNVVWALMRIAPFAPAATRRALADSLRSGSNVNAWRREIRPWSGVLCTALEVDGVHVDAAQLQSLLLDPDPSVVAVACRVIAARRTEFASLRRDLTLPLARTVATEFESRSVLGRVWCVSPTGLTDVNARVLRTEASTALYAIAPDHPATLLGLCQRLFDLDLPVRIEAARKLGARRDADAGRWLLDAACNETNQDAVLAMLEAMARIGTDLAHLAPQVLACGKDRPDRIARIARAVALSLDPDLESRPPIAASFELLELGVSPQDGIDLKAEMARLLAWLDSDDGSNRWAIQRDERAIDDFHALESAAGGRQNRSLRWVPVRIIPNEFRPGTWIDSLGDSIDGVVVAAPRGAIGPGRARLRSLPWIVELVPCDRRRPHFDLDDTELRAERDPSTFRFSVLRRSDYDTFFADVATRGHYIARVVGGLTVSIDLPAAGQAAPRGTGRLWVDPAAEDRLPVIRTLLQR